MGGDTSTVSEVLKAVDKELNKVNILLYKYFESEVVTNEICDSCKRCRGGK